MLSADYRDGQCLVSLRDTMAGFTVDLRRRSNVNYVLVNRVTRQALTVGARDYFSSYPVFGRAMSLLLAEHVAVMRRNLVFEFPEGRAGTARPRLARRTRWSCRCRSATSGSSRCRHRCTSSRR